MDGQVATHPISKKTPFQMNCPCCVVPSITVQLIATAAALIYGQRWLIPNTGYPRTKKVAQVCTWIVAILLSTFALALAVLNVSSSLRAMAFAKFCTYMGLQASPLDEYRCPLIQKHTRGMVVEFGPGPGTNFKCLGNGTSDAALISQYVAVDPNPNFDGVRQDEKDRWGLTFPLVSVGLRGEDVDIESGIYDTVIGTHVLCSVDSPAIVLAAMDKALKPGGRFLFMEHVLASPERRIVRWLQQNVAAPLFAILGNGCSFMDTGVLLEGYFGGKDGFAIELTHFEAPGVPPPLRPHILGIVTKK